MTALFVQNCGADANPLPLLMRSDDNNSVELARMYGSILAEAVAQVVSSKMKPIQGPLRAAIAETEVPFQPGPSRSALEVELTTAEGARERQIQHVLQVY